MNLQACINLFFDVEHHFSHYLNSRWPALEEAKSHWTKTFKDLNLKYVIGSSLYDAESQLPLWVANELGIQTFSVPHSGVTLPDNLDNARTILYNFPIQKTYWTHAGVNEKRLKKAKGLVPENQHKLDEGIKLQDKVKKNILIITKSIARDGRMLNTGIRQLINDHVLLSTIPDNILENLEVIVKVYPSDDEVELIRSIATIDERVKVYGQVDLTPLLTNADLVIILDNVGSIMIHTINFDKPFIFYTPEDDRCIHNMTTKVIRDQLVTAGVMVESEKELWETTSKFFGEEQFKEQLLTRVHKGKTKLTAYDDFPSIDHYLN